MSEPFFIVGSARSGTTLLRMLFNAHPDIAVPPESRFIVELRPDHDPVEVESFLAGLTGHGRFAYWEISTDQIRKEIGDRSSVSYREAIEAVYRAYARAQGKSRWGDKTPRYVEHVEFLASLWPGARFVHVVRDGRDVALSYGDLPFGPKTVAKAAQLWAARVSAGRRNGRALGDRYLEIRYEDLVNDLETTTRTLCDFVEVEFDPAMLDYPERAQSAVLARAERYNPRVMEKPVRKARSWPDQMPTFQVEVFEAVVGDVLSELGYPRRYPRPGTRARLAARAGLAGVPLGRLGRTGPRNPGNEEENPPRPAQRPGPLLRRMLKPVRMRMRKRRHRRFLALLEPLPRPLRILDVGGAQRFWEGVDFVGRDDAEITLLNLSPVDVRHEGFTYALGDARDMGQFGDDEFEVVFSNSVIEHVGGLGDQRKMAEEIRRVGIRYFVQTPNRRFPIEPHTFFPFFQFLPVGARVFLLRHLPLVYGGRIRDPEQARERVEGIRLLTFKELRDLFPGASIERERVLGFTKSFMVHGGFGPQR
jgi:hypothetical protein